MDHIIVNGVTYTIKPLPWEQDQLRRLDWTFGWNTIMHELWNGHIDRSEAERRVQTLADRIFGTAQETEHDA